MVRCPTWSNLFDSISRALACDKTILCRVGHINENSCISGPTAHPRGEKSLAILHIILLRKKLSPLYEIHVMEVNYAIYLDERPMD